MSFNHINHWKHKPFAIVFCQNFASALLKTAMETWLLITYLYLHNTERFTTSAGRHAHQSVVLRPTVKKKKTHIQRSDILVDSQADLRPVLLLQDHFAHQ